MFETDAFVQGQWMHGLAPILIALGAAFAVGFLCAWWIITRPREPDHYIMIEGRLIPVYRATRGEFMDSHHD